MWQPTSPTTDEAPPFEAARQRSASMKMKNPGRRFASIIKLRPEHVDEYKAAHRDVWPEVLKEIKDCGIEDCKCNHAMARYPILLHLLAVLPSSYTVRESLLSLQ